MTWCTLNGTPARGDAIVVSKAMSASTIAEIFIEDDTIRVELEIGAEDLAAFKNLLPDEIYGKFFFDERPYQQRIKQFFDEDWLLRTDQGNALVGHVASFEARRRISRDEVTGQPQTQPQPQPLGLQPADAPIVVYAVLAFDLEGKPQSVSIRPPSRFDDKHVAANIGFVTYHQGLPVTDFRYLGAEETLDLDWDDPWYSRFRNPNLRRQYDSPVSVFLYVEPFEVRKEIVIRPVDLQRWIDLDIDVSGVIPVEAQAALIQQVAGFFKDKHPVTIDGQKVSGKVDRIHFIRRTLRKTGVIYPDEDLPTSSATLGVIIIYPVESLPQQVSMTWESFDAKFQKIPASATDEAGGLPTTLTPDDPVLVWNNYLTHPTIPAMRSVPPPAGRAHFMLPLISIACGLGSVLVIVFMLKSTARQAKWVAWLIVLVALGWASFPFMRVSIANPFVPQQQLVDHEANEVMDSLLHNLYHAFDRKQENLVYDQLATSLSGDLLRDIYLQTRQRIQLADQGGAQIKIDNIDILANDIRSYEDRGFTCRTSWVVAGTIGHWGHLHRRALGYEADFRVEPVDEGWKITSMQIINETQPELPAASMP